MMMVIVIMGTQFASPLVTLGADWASINFNGGDLSGQWPRDCGIH